MAIGLNFFLRIRHWLPWPPWVESGLIMYEGNKVRSQSRTWHSLINKVCSPAKSNCTVQYINKLWRYWSDCTNTQSDLGFDNSHLWTVTSENIPSHICAQKRFRSACAFAQSDQNLHWAYFGYSRMQRFYMRKKDTDQTPRMRRLICVFIRRTWPKVRFCTLWL